MILADVSLALKVLNQSADFIIKLQEIQMNFTVAGEVKIINAKLDQDITRKMKAGYENIGIALRSNRDPEYKKQDLELARNYLHDCLNLSSELKTEEVPNDDIMGTAHYGLAIVYNLEGDSFRASYHLFKAFLTSPRNARELSPEIYTQFFPHCGARVMTLDREQAVKVVESRGHVEGKEDELIKTATEIGKIALKAATLAVGGIAVVLSAGRIPPNVFIYGGHAANKGIDNIKPDPLIQARERTRVQTVAEELMKRVEGDARKQDDCCKRTAAEYLTKLN